MKKGKPSPSALWGEWWRVIISYFVKVSLLFSVVGFALWGDLWLSAISLLGLAITIAPSVMSHNFKIILPTGFEIVFLLFVYASMFLGETFQFYEVFWWWDLFLHTFSGFALGLLGFLLLYILDTEERLRASAFLMAVFSFTFAMAWGGVWEIFEYIIDQGFHTTMQDSLNDTMTDLIVDCIGALVVAIWGYIYLHFWQTGMIKTWVQEFRDKNPELFRHQRRGWKRKSERK